MAVPTLLSSLSTTAASNPPAGSENTFPDLDNHLRAAYAFIAEVRDSVAAIPSVEGYPTLTVVTGTTQTGAPSGWYEMTNAALSTFTLPPTPTVGDWCIVGFTNDLLTNVIARNGSKIMGATDNLTVDIAKVSLTVVYVDTTIGWKVF